MAYRRTPHVQARLDAQRAALIAAATEILAEQGFRACGIAPVAARAGIAAGSVYTHFASKSELVTEVFRCAVAAELTAVSDAAARSDTASEQIRALVETFAARAARSPRRAYALLAEPAEPAVDRLRLAYRRSFAESVQAILAGGVARGELPAQDTAVVAAAVVGAIAEALTAPLADTTASHHSAVDGRLVATVVQVIHRAIGVTADAYA